MVGDAVDGFDFGTHVFACHRPQATAERSEEVPGKECGHELVGGFVFAVDTRVRAH